MDAVVTPPAVGTSLEVLAPYLPYGVEVEHINITYDGIAPRGIIDAVKVRSGLLDMAYRNAYWSIKNVLPVLRPFSALCDPLPDGTVPALALARIAVPEVECVTAEIINDGGGRVYCWCRGAQGQSYYAIHKNNFEPTTKRGKVANRLDGRLTDKLREMHFALPVNGRPLVAGVDFIAKQ